MTNSHATPIDVTLAKVALSRVDRADGSQLLASLQKLGPYSRCVGEWLAHWAETTPETAFLCERGKDGEWKTVTYAQAQRQVWAIAEYILARGLGPEQPVAALSSNSIAMGLMMLGSMQAGVPFAPVSQAYATVATDFTKLKHVFEQLSPGLLFVSDLKTYAPALQRANLSGFELVSALDRDDGATPFQTLCATLPTDRAFRAYAAVNGETVGKILFTSGSTGAPKGVINTQRMMCSNQQALAQLFPFYTETPPVMVDWLPWNHTAGANGSFNKVLRHGGTLYIDDGRPVPGEFHKTIANIASVNITCHTNVPRGFELLLQAFERDVSFASHFFSNLEQMAFAGAAMPQQHYERLRELATQWRGNRILFSAGYGATETAPTVTIVHFANSEQSNIGLPVPGTEIKLLPNGDKLELRVRGPNVMPGYWRQPVLSREAFDEEGFYRIGDAAKYLDPNRPEAGLLFDGRVSEDFKLTSATWVNVASIRARAIAAGDPLIQDVVVAGHDRESIGLLVVLNEPAARSTAGLSGPSSLEELARSPAVRDFVRSTLVRLQAQSTGSSTRPARALILERAPSLDNGELTDKGSISQRAVLTNRKAEVEVLYSDAPMVITTAK